MSNFSRFQARNAARVTAQKDLNTSFVFNSYPATTITSVEDTSVTKKAAVVNQQEKDIAYVYTQKTDELSIGSLWTVKKLCLLIAEEITIIKDVNWNKYKCFLCNVNFGDIWGYFIGPEKSYINVSLEKQSMYVSQQKPILVTASNKLNFRDVLLIKGRAWIVQEYDAISTEGLIYCSLAPTTISKEIIDENIGKDVIISHFDETAQTTTIKDKITTEEKIPNEIITIAPNKLITLDTIDGFFVFDNKNIKIKKRNLKTVIFYLPNGVDKATVQVKKENENKEVFIETYIFKAVI